LKKGIKAKEHEKLDEATINKVISLLNASPPITKKEACEVLNISYNTTRLNAILAEHEEKLARRKKQYEAKKGTPLDDNEISRIIQWYLQGSDVSEIASLIFRQPSRVSQVLDSLGVPRRLKGKDNYTPSLLPEECISTSFEPGEVVWSAFYDSPAEIVKLNGVSKNKSPLYQIYVLESSESRRKAGFYANQPVEELGSLKHLTKYITVSQLTSEK